MRNFRPLCVAFLLFSPALAFSQQQESSDSSAPPVSSSVAPTNTSSPSLTDSASPALPGGFDRWLDLRQFDFSLRYRSVMDSNNAHEFNQGQQRGIIDGKFKFDAQGKYGIVFHGSTGHYFNWAYADFIGGGTQKAYGLEYVKATPLQQTAIDTYLTPQRALLEGASGGWSFYLRRLYLDLEPISGIEFQYGSLDINRGAASEITTYDNDGYIDGERILIKRPKNLFFDEASITYAYIGDLYTPNFFARGERLGQTNYHQFLVRKKFLWRADGSFDYTVQDKANTLRQAVEVRIPETRVLDTVRVETYERLNAISFSEVVDFAPGGKGFALTFGKKNIAHRFSLDWGYAHIDPHQGVLTQSETSATFCMGVNGDAYGLGSRYFVHPTVKLTSYLDLTGFYTHEVGGFSVHDQIVWNTQALNAGINFDIKKAFFPRTRE